jgi:hypothetical protein
MDWYRDYRGIFSFRGYPVIELIPVMVVFYFLCYLYFRKEFMTYQLQSSEAEQDAPSNGG